MRIGAVEGPLDFHKTLPDAPPSAWRRELEERESRTTKLGYQCFMEWRATAIRDPCGTDFLGVNLPR